MSSLQPPEVPFAVQADGTYPASACATTNACYDIATPDRRRWPQSRVGVPGTRHVRSRHMSVRRVMGTETEFGISVTGQPLANPMVASSRVVNAYAGSTLRARRARWDFEEESPLRDARGFDMSRQVADPSQLTDEDLGLANVILTNGARLYVDHAHPEYSTPGVHQPARHRALGQGGGAGGSRRLPVREHAR